MGSMKTGRLFTLSFLGLIVSVAPIFANDYSTHRRNREDSTGALWIPANVQESWRNMENVSTAYDPSPVGIPLKNAERKTASGSRRPKRLIVDLETDSADWSTLLRQELRKRSCEAEASKFGWNSEIGATTLAAHGTFCEADKLLRYAWLSVKSLEYEFGLDQLLDAEIQEKRLRRLLSEKSPFEAVEYYLTRLQRYLSNPEYLEYLFIVVQNSVPVAEIRETWNRLEIAVEHLADRIEELVGSCLDLHFGVDADADAATQLREEIVAARGDALRFVRETLSDRIERNQLRRTVSFVEWLFDRFLESKLFHRYFPALKGVADALRDFHRGFRASGFRERVIAPVRNFISTSLADVREIPSANRILSDGQQILASIFRAASTASGESLSSIPYDVASRIVRRSFEPEGSSSSLESSSPSPTTVPTRTTISDHVPGTSATGTVLVMAAPSVTEEETDETSPLSAVTSTSSETSYAASLPLLRRSRSSFSPPQIMRNERLRRSLRALL